MMLSVGWFCLNRMSQMSRTPSVFTVKKTAGLTGLQQASISRDVWYLTQEQVRLELQDQKLSASLELTWWT